MNQKVENQNEDDVRDDYDVDDEHEEGEYDYWYCYSCGYSCSRKPDFGMQCPKCTAIMSGEYY